MPETGVAPTAAPDPISDATMEAEETTIATAAPPPGAVEAGHPTSMSEAAPEEILVGPPPPSLRPTPSRIGRGTDRESAAIPVWAAVVGIREIEIGTAAQAVAPTLAPTLSQCKWQAVVGAGAPPLA